MTEMASRSRIRTIYFRTFTLLVAVAAAVVATLMMSVPAWAASKVFVTDVSPDGGATSVAADSNVIATFSEAMKASTIKGSTFYLKKQGSSTTIPANVSYSGTSKTATLNPDSNLEAGATYTAYIKGGRRGVKASNGDSLGGTTDSTATFANGKVSWTFTVAMPLPPPETNITSGPSGTVNSASATFEFSSSEFGSTFQCALDNSSYSSCNSPQSYIDLSDGSHTFYVKASGAAGNTDPTPATRTWTVDATAPTISSASPADQTQNVAPSTNVEATFSEAMDSSTLTASTFTLTKQGSSTPIAATVSYSSTTKKATLDPSSDLASNTTYTATIKGGFSGAKDSAGNALAQDYSWTFTIAPPTVVSHAPTSAAGSSTNVTATFSVDMDPNSISDQTFTLTKQGSSSSVAAHVSYDRASKKATLDPDSDLVGDTSYTATIKGGSSGVKDLAGNALAQDYSWTFMVCGGGVVLSPGSIRPSLVVCG